MSAEGKGALDGIRVLDLSTGHAAYAGRLLADLGAEVILVEPPGGALLRRAAPLMGEASLAHEFFNANKKSVTLDLADAAGRAAFGGLVAGADIVIEALPPGTLAGWGIGYETLAARNPRLILVSISPFGQSGPRAQERATDLTLLAAGGLLSLGGYLDLGPVAVTGGQAEIASGIFGAVSALVALLQRLVSGAGQWADVSGQECVAFALEDAIPGWYLNRRIRSRTGDRAREAGTGVYPCRDGYISMVAGRLGTAKAFKTLTEWCGASEVEGAASLLEPCWQDFDYRQSEEGITRFETIFGRFCATRGKQELYREGQARQIAIAPVNTIADVMSDPQLAANGFFQTMVAPALGRALTYPGAPYRLSQTPPRLHTAAPAPGQHNAELLGPDRF